MSWILTYLCLVTVLWNSTSQTYVKNLLDEKEGWRDQLEGWTRGTEIGIRPIDHMEIKISNEDYI